MKRLHLAAFLAASLFGCASSPAMAQTTAKPTIGGCGGWSNALAKDKARLTMRRACYAQVGPIAAAEIAKVDAALAKLAPTTPAPTPTPALVWKDCAAEGETCRFDGTAQVRYGAGDKLVTKTATGEIACTNAVFGDPVEGTVKRCQTSAAVVKPQPVATTPPVVTPAPTPTPIPVVAKKPFQLGINLVSGVYWSPEQLFTNLATSDEWPSELLTDDMGNIALKAGQQARRQLHPPVAVLAHTAKVDVTCTWNGGATGRMDGNHRTTKPVQYSAGRIAFEWNGLDAGAGMGTWLDFTGPGEVRNLACLEAGADRRQIFSSEFLASIKPYSVLRNLDISPGNSARATDQIVWATRTKPGSIDQLANEQMSYELFVDLNNQNGSSPWFTLPYNASPEYHRALAQMVHDRLNPKLAVYVEDGNELWNPAFATNAIARRVGMAAKLNDNEWIAGHLAYANHVKATMAIWADVFKDRPGQLVRIYGAWSGSPWHTELAFNEGKIGGHVDAVAIAPYFGHDLADQLKNVPDRAQRIAAMNAAVDKAIGEMKAQKALTDRFGVRLVAYEAGQHIVGGDAMTELNRDPAMYDAYKRYIAAWRDTVGDLMTLYNATGRISNFGAWGIREYAGQPLSEAPKRRAALEMAPAR